MFKFIKWVVFLLFLCALFSPLWVTFLAIEKTPVVATEFNLTTDDIQRIKKLIKDNDPREIPEGQSKQLNLSEKDINLATAYVLSKLPGISGTAIHTDLFPEQAIIDLTIKIPDNPLGGFININTVLTENGNQASVEKLKIGRLKVPGQLIVGTSKIIDPLFAKHPRYQELKKVAQAIQQVKFKKQLAQLTISVDKGLAKSIAQQGKSWVMPGVDNQRVSFYYDRLANITNKLSYSKTSLINIIAPYFQTVVERTNNGEDAIYENRTALLVLGLYLSGSHPEKIVGKLNTTQQARKLKLTLNSRQDLAQHYMISAAISASAGVEVSQLVGLSKEIKDAEGQSGFSFSDLTADEAGTRLGEAMVSSKKQAVQFQKRLSSINDEKDIMPFTDDLLDGLSQKEFESIYKNTSSEEYQSVLRQIKQRIDACEIFNL